MTSRKSAAPRSSTASPPPISCRAFSTRWIAASQLPDQRERLAKVRVLRATQPLEDGHLGRDDLRAVPFEPPDRRLLALGLPRTDRIPHEINALTRPDQAEHGLHDADMRLAAADDDIGPVRQRRREIRHTARVKAHLGEDWRLYAIRELRNCRAEPGRVLLGDQHRDAEHLRGL